MMKISDWRMAQIYLARLICMAFITMVTLIPGKAQSGSILTNMSGKGWGSGRIWSSVDKPSYDLQALSVKFTGATQLVVTQDVSGIVFTGISEIDRLNEKYQCIKMHKLFRGKTPKVDWDKELSYGLYFRYPIDVPTAIQEYTATGYFEHVLTNQLLDISFDHLHKAQLVPNDPNFPDQWALDNDSVTAEMNFNEPAVVDADIDMPTAWDCGQGDSNVVVAVVGTGILRTHPEFNGRIWQNKNEILGDNVDNDANGYIDDNEGWDFFQNDNDPNDTDGHETSIASIIGANGNNSDGISGVDWQCKLMAVRVAEQTGTVTALTLAEGLAYAVNNGANVINFSASFPQNDTTIRNAIYHAYTNDIVFVAAIGNSNGNFDFYPAAYDDSVGVFAVGATSADDSRTAINTMAGSTYSTNLDVVAPGNNILSLDHQLNIVVNGGTSEATAHTSGLVALLRGQDSTLSSDSVISMIKMTAEDQVGLASEDTPGFDIFHGHGRINAGAALCLANQHWTPLPNNAKLEVFPNPTTATIQVELRGIRFKKLQVRVYDATGRIVYHEFFTSVQDFEIPLPDSLGIYLVEFLIDGKYQATHRIVKN